VTFPSLLQEVENNGKMDFFSIDPYNSSSNLSFAGKYNRMLVFEETSRRIKLVIIETMKQLL